MGFVPTRDARIDFIDCYMSAPHAAYFSVKVVAPSLLTL